MSYRTKRSRLGNSSKAKDATSQTLQDVVSQVIRDVAATEEQDKDALNGINHEIDNAGTTQTQPTQSTVAGEVRPNKRISGKRQSFVPLPSEPVVNDSQHPRASNRQPYQGLASGGAQADETEIETAADVWLSDPVMTEPTQGVANGTNDLRPNQKIPTGRASRTPPPRHIERLQNWVHENDGKPFQHGISEARHTNPSGWDNDVEFDDGEEIDKEPAQPGFPQSGRSNMGKWANDIQFDEMEEVEMRDAEGKRGKKGGGILPRHVWSLRPGVRFVVPFNSLDQPVKKGGYVLVRFLGDIAKTCELCPIGEVNWHKVDKSYKANIITLVRERFVLPDRPTIDKCILKHVGNKWRNYRHELKSQYKKPDTTQGQVASTVPKGIPSSQWVKLVQYWFSEKCKLLSKKGKEARDYQAHLRVSGAKSFARRRDEFEKAHGREPGALEWFLETHQRKDGTFLDNSSKEFVDAAAAALIAQRGSTSSCHTTVENQVFNELMYSDEERVYQRPLGYGVRVTGNKGYEVEAESRKRGYTASGSKSESSKKKLFWAEKERRNCGGYLPQDTTTEVDRLNFAMTAMGETNQLMQGQIKMQSRQLQMQSQQLQMQSKQIEGLQVQLQQVTSLLTKFGARLNSTQTPQSPHMFKGSFFPANRRVQEASPEYSDEDSDSSDWDSDQ